MKITNNNTDADKLTNRDLAMAAYSLAQLHNVYVEALSNGSYEGELTREEMEKTVESIRAAHIKFDALLQATQAAYEAQDKESGE